MIRPGTTRHHPMPHDTTQNTPGHNTTTQPCDAARPNAIVSNKTQGRVTQRNSTAPTASFSKENMTQSATTWHDPAHHLRLPCVPQLFHMADWPQGLEERAQRKGSTASRPTRSTTVHRQNPRDTDKKNKSYATCAPRMSYTRTCNNTQHEVHAHVAPRHPGT